MLMLVSSMVIFGTVGIFRAWIPLPSGLLAFSRGVIGALVLSVPAVVQRKKTEGGNVKKRLPLLLISGAMIGVNWILLFEAYRYTSVSTATLCYYMAPVFVIAASPLVLREKLTAKKALCLLCAVAGMLLVSGVLGESEGRPSAKGVFFGLGAAALYAGVILINKRLTDVPATVRTPVQIGAAALAALPYVLLTDGMDYSTLDIKSLLLLLFMGAVHTGAAYLLYFAAIPDLSAQTAAIFSYIDPVTALLLSAVLLHENIGVSGAVGAALILGAALFSEIEIKIKKNKKKA
jgi:RarD protein